MTFPDLIVFQRRTYSSGSASARMGEDFNGGERLEEPAAPAVRRAVAAPVPASLAWPADLFAIMAGHELVNRVQRLILGTVGGGLVI